MARPSFASRSSRLSIAISTAAESSRHNDSADTLGENRIHEIEEIRRYEDFTSIDWVQDAANAQVHGRLRQHSHYGVSAPNTFWSRLESGYEAGQAWLVITIVGGCIGLNAAFLNIITEWLSDFKLGHCRTAFYLNESFCCWGAEDGCNDWRTWSNFGLLNYLIYCIFSLLFASISAILIRSFAPYAAGSGISEIKCIIAGFVMKGFLGWWTLLIKSIGLPLAIASGLSVGKEGPSVHYAVCIGNVISRFFSKYKKNAAKTREILSACAAAGVAVAFGSPIGGVLFSLEEMSSKFPLKTMWRSYFCALVGTAVLAAMNPFRTGQLVMFQVHYDRDWHFFEIIFFIVLGLFGGIYGAFVIKWNLKAQAFRRRFLGNHAVLEATVLAAFTAIICYPNIFLRIDMTESMEILFRECEGGHDYHGLCKQDRRVHVILSLVIATILRTGLIVISYGCKVPAGIFVPSMAVGASFGRTLGILVQALHEAYPKLKLFASCEPDLPCITPGTYAFLGAAAALSGIMHLTVSVVVIMFELTGALTYILPTMIVVGVTKAVSEQFGRGGIADRMIWFNGFPFLDNKEEHAFGVPISQIMTYDLTSIPSFGLQLEELEAMLSSSTFQGFPIIEDQQSKLLVGVVGRQELRFAIDRAKKDSNVQGTAICYFSNVPVNNLGDSDSDSNVIPSTSYSSFNFSRFIDQTPLTVHPHLPLETTMEIFKKLGPRRILVEQHGKLLGLVTVKDVLRYQAKVEANTVTRDDVVEGIFEERLWAVILDVTKLVRQCYDTVISYPTRRTTRTRLSGRRQLELSQR